MERQEAGLASLILLSSTHACSPVAGKCILFIIIKRHVDDNSDAHPDAVQGCCSLLQLLFQDVPVMYLTLVALVTGTRYSIITADHKRTHILLHTYINTCGSATSILYMHSHIPSSQHSSCITYVLNLAASYSLLRANNSCV